MVYTISIDVDDFAFFIVPIFIREGAGIIDRVLPFCFIGGRTIFAWFLWEKTLPVY